MRTAVVLILGAGILVSGCATRRGVLAADRYDARVQRAQCQDARAYRGRRAQAVQCAQAREARQQLQADRAAPY